MYSKEKLLEMLSSEKASTRYDACEWIRVSQESSPRIIKALEKATHDEDKEVAESANLALQADIHHQMATKMGIIEPNKIPENNSIHSNIDQSSSSHSQLIESTNVTEYERRGLEAPIPKEEYSCLEMCQAITFFVGAFTILALAINPSSFFEMGAWSWILIGTLIFYIGLQIYATIQFGFGKSFHFFKFLASGRGGRGGK
jgi:hypothetical protein